ncbi:DNA-directed RNA polymerase III subunit RPC7 isoform X1 [Rhinoderma darwinii]|uniref:DNA-directed RNA polymerase III subunit RPC7 isoform X1 n=1 Tax=Rhinoderma darwinii TaxID=43563 RepID=UPI003F67697F
MAGRGRGRGSNFTFDLQAIGFSRGDALPETQAQPKPLYPHTEYKPSSLLEGEEQDYLLALKQELRGNVKCLPYYMGRGDQKSNVDKYSAKYLQEAEKKRTAVWTPDWRLLPKEMQTVKKKRKKVLNLTEKKAKAAKPGTNVDVLKKIEELEKKGDDEKSDEENEEKEKEKKKKGEDDEEEEVEADVEEEENEEENDYIASYFEDGDDFAASDDNMDEATY